MKQIWLGCLVVLSLFSTSLYGQQGEDDGQTYQRLGDWEVHYSAFPSTFLLPEIATRYQLTRSNSQGVVNISVLDATSEERQAQRVQVTGYTLNEPGQRRNLTFRRHVDGDAIYYIAQVPHGREDTLRFFVTIRSGTDEQTLNFNHTFYRQ